MTKIEAVVRKELEEIGAVEVQRAGIRPVEGESAGETFVVKDRRGRGLALSTGGAHAVEHLVSGAVRSHRQLPVTLFQIGHRFKDVERPHKGLLDAREDVVVEAHAIAADSASLGQVLVRMRGAAAGALRRCGVPFDEIPANDGWEFVTRCDTGDDIIVVADGGKYMASLAGAETGPRPWTFGGDPAGDLETVPTPGVTTVQDVARFMGVAPADVLKTLVFRATPSEEWTGYETAENLTTPAWVIAVVRGDHEVNVAKLSAAAREAFHVSSITPATEEAADDFAFGYVGPDVAIRKIRAVLVVDPDAAQDRPWVAGANESGHHVRNFNWFRECGQPLADPRKVAVADIRNVVDGDPAPGGGTLRLVPAITLGHVTPLPPAEITAGGVRFQDDAGAQRLARIGACEVNLSRVMAAIVETQHDQRGIVWPAAIAPYSVVLTPIQYDGQTREATDRIHADLLTAGVDVLLDDRDLRAGAKFADADLIGIPIRINVGERGLKRGVAEVKRRTAAEIVEVDLDRLVEAVLALLAPAATGEGQR